MSNFLSELETNLLKKQFINQVKLFDEEKLSMILKKLAIGHATFETDSLFKFSDEATIKFKFLYELTDGKLTTFNNDVICDILPEVGSRFASNVNIIDSGNGDVFVTSLWHRVEEKMYRYAIDYYMMEQL